MSGRLKISLIIVLLIAIGIGRAIIKQDEQTGRTLLFAYRDLVISGAEISLKEFNQFQYTSLSLFGQWNFTGQYHVSCDTIYLSYDASLPPIASEKIILQDGMLIFLNEDDSFHYSFYINSSSTQIDSFFRYSFQPGK